MKLHLGCGKRDFGKDWIHIDGGDFPHVIWHDIVNLPYERESVDLIYASHVFEYFDQAEARDVLAHWSKVLKKGGILRLAVPDFEAIAKLYAQGKYSLDDFIGPLYGRMSMGSSMIFHKICYDFSKLKSTLEESGFKNIRRYDWQQTEHAQFDDHSQAYLPHLNKETGVLISLNVEAEKI